MKTMRVKQTVPVRQPEPAPLPQWEAEYDPEEMNTALLRILRHTDARRQLSETQMERLTGIKRQQMHKLHCMPMHLTIPTLMKWGNGNHLDLEWLVHLAKLWLRHKHHH